MDIVNDWYHKIDSINITDITGVKDFIFSTIHREENVENENTLRSIINGFKRIAEHSGVRVIMTLMPRTKSCLDKFGIDYSGINTIEPVGFFECLALQKSAKFILTDSGTIQEESCILGTHCLTIRDSTERPQAMECGGGILAGTTEESIFEAYLNLANLPKTWDHPFGDGRSSEKIFLDIERRISSDKKEMPWINKRISRGWKK